MNKKRILIFVVIGILAAGALFLLLRPWPEAVVENETVEPEPEKRYGIVLGNHYIEEGEIRPGENLGVILGRYGIGPSRVDSLVRVSEGVFNIRSIRAGQKYYAFLTPDSLDRRLDHFVYPRNNIDYVVFNFLDSLSIRLDSLPVRTERRIAEGAIESSLWNAMVGGGHSPALAMELEDMYGWTIDFFGLQKGDAFRVIYEERFVDTLSIDHGRLWGAWFEHNGKRHYAIPFDQGGKTTYWDEAGNSLRRNVLMAPMKSYSRISSRFSHARLHPILRIRRPHHGVDYAAPSGTHFA